MYESVPRLLEEYVTAAGSSSFTEWLNRLSDRGARLEFAFAWIESAWGTSATAARWVEPFVNFGLITGLASVSISARSGIRSFCSSLAEPRIRNRETSTRREHSGWTSGADSREQGIKTLQAGVAESPSGSC